MSATHERQKAVDGIQGFRTTCEGCGAEVLVVRTVEDRVARYHGDTPPEHAYLTLNPEPSEAGCVAIDVMGYCQPLRVGHPLHLGKLRQPHVETCDGSLAAQAPAPARRDLE